MARERWNDDKTIKKDSEDERDKTNRREGSVKKDDAQREKIRGEKKRGGLERVKDQRSLLSGS